MTAENNITKELSQDEARLKARVLIDELNLKLENNADFKRKLLDKFLHDPTSLVIDESFHISFLSNGYGYDYYIFRPMFEDRVALQKTKQGRDGIRTEDIRLNASMIMDDKDAFYGNINYSSNNITDKRLRMKDSEEALLKVREFIQNI